MKSIHRSAVIGLLLACSGVAAAESASLNEFRPKVMPVLVQVNSHGKITEASPAIELAPNMSRLLRANLDEMISKPAADKHGRPMSSQFIVNLALEASRRDNGDYDAYFRYVSTSPVPAGSWYWVHIDGHRLALANRNGQNRWQHAPYQQRHYEPYQRRFERTPTPSMNNAAHNAPASSPPSRPAK